jgi:hypothetical protein
LEWMRTAEGRRECSGPPAAGRKHPRVWEYVAVI